MTKNDVAAPAHAAPAPPETSAERQRERRRRFRAVLLEALDQPGADGAASKMQEIANTLITKATEGDLSAIKEVLDRVGGKTAPAAPDADEEPVKVTFAWESGP